MKKGSGFSMEVLKFTKKDSEKTKCFGHGRRIMFLLRNVFAGRSIVFVDERIEFRSPRQTDRKIQSEASELSSLRQVRMRIYRANRMLQRKVYLRPTRSCVASQCTSQRRPLLTSPWRPLLMS